MMQMMLMMQGSGEAYKILATPLYWASFYSYDVIKNSSMTSFHFMIQPNSFCSARILNEPMHFHTLKKSLKKWIYCQKAALQVLRCRNLYNYIQLGFRAVAADSSVMKCSQVHAFTLHPMWTGGASALLEHPPRVLKKKNNSICFSCAQVTTRRIRSAYLESWHWWEFMMTVTVRMYEDLWQEWRMASPAALWGSFSRGAGAEKSNKNKTKTWKTTNFSLLL